MLFKDLWARLYMCFSNKNLPCFPTLAGSGVESMNLPFVLWMTRVVRELGWQDRGGDLRSMVSSFPESGPIYGLQILEWKVAVLLPRANQSHGYFQRYQDPLHILQSPRLWPCQHNMKVLTCAPRCLHPDPSHALSFAFSSVGCRRWASCSL